MDDVNAAFTSILLKQARAAIKEAGIKVGKLTTWKDTCGTNPWFEVWVADKNYAVWSGSAFNAAEAKANYLSSLLPEEGENE